MKINKAFLPFLLLFSAFNSVMLGAQEIIDQEEVVPLLSHKQLEVQMKKFRRYLDKVNRCMITGPCTKEELKQVRKHALVLLKGMGILTLTTLFVWKGVPAMKRKAKSTFRSIKRDILQQAIDTLESKEDPDKEMATLKKKLSDAFKDRLKESTKTAIVSIETTMLEQLLSVLEKEKVFEIGPITEVAYLKQEIKAALKERIEETIQFVKGEFEKELDHVLTLLVSIAWQIPSLEELEKRAKEKAGEFIWSLPADHDIVQVIEKWMKHPKEQLRDFLKDEDIREKLTNFINRLSEETHVINFINQIRGGRIIIEELGRSYGIPTGWKITDLGPELKEEKEEKE